MSNLIFPLGLAGARIVSRSPSHKTATGESLSRREYRSSWEFIARTRYSVAFDFLRSTSQAEFQQLFGFIARHGGSLDSFLLIDPEDYSVTAHPFGVGNGSTTSFQLQRTFVQAGDLAAPASRAYWPAFGDGYEPVFEPDTASDQEFVNGTPTSVTHGANGLVTFAAAPAAGAVLTWTGTYKKRVRFASDDTDAERIVQQLWKTGSVELISVKP